MAQAYTRQSSFSDGDSITAALFNNEYNQLVNVFAYSSSSASSTGHRHDGTAGEGGNIFKIGDLDFLNKVEIDSTNNRIGFYTEVSSAAVEQLRIQDGALVPVTDSDIDLGTTSLRFKDTFTDSITTTGNVDVGGNLTVTGTTTFNGGTLTLGDAADDNVVFGADVNSNIIPNTDNAYDLGSSSQEWKDLYVDGIAYLDGINFNGTAITSTATELNLLDGVTATTTELNYVDVTTAGTVEASKAVVADSNADVLFSDNDKLKFGTGSDLEIYHDNHSHILNVTGDLFIKNTSDDKDIIFQSDDGSGGLETYFYVDGSGKRIFFEQNTRHTDNFYAAFGSDADLRIFHDGANSYIRQSSGATGNLIIEQDLTDADILFKGDDGGSTITALTLDMSDAGTATFNHDVKLGDGGEVMFGAGTDLRIAHNSTDSFITNNTGDLYINQFADDKDIKLRCDDGSGGIASYITLDGSAALTQFDKNTKHVDSVKATFGDSADLEIYHDGSSSYIKDTGTGGLFINGSQIVLASPTGEVMINAVPDNAVSLYYDNSVKLATFGTGIVVTDEILTANNNTDDTNKEGHFLARQYDSGTETEGFQILQYFSNSSENRVDLGGASSQYNAATSIKFYTAANTTTRTGTERLSITNSGIDVTGNVSLSGDIQKTGQITLDASTDIALDTDSGIILFKDGGTNKGRITTSGDIISIVNSTQNGDIKFDGLNGSSSITALRLDMSEGGRATFNEDVEAQGLYVGSRNASYDFYNNGTTYLNGAVTVDDNITVTGTVDGVDVASIGSTVAGLSTVATSGAYSDLSGLPTIPTSNNQLTNGAGFTTYTSNQSLNTTDSPTFSTVYVSNWFRATGQSGLYFQSYGGGWYMIDSTWIRNYGSKPLYMNAQIACTSNITAYYSDERLKDKQGKIENALDKVSQIETFYFKENELAKELGHSNDKKQVGVSAQSVKKVLPEIVDLAPFDMDTKEDGEIVSMSGEDYMTIDYAKLTPLLIEAIKELKAEIKELKESK